MATGAGPGDAAPAAGAAPTDGLIATFGLCLGVLLAGLAALFHATAGGTAYTTETLRRSEVAQAPLPVPDFRVIDAQGREQGLRELLAGDGRVWIVDFVYTRCATLCLALGTVFQQLQAELVAQGLQDRVGLLSISFDFSTAPTVKPARSYSPGGYMSGISAVSPPIRAQPASSQPRAMPETTDTVVSTCSLPVAK